MVSGLKERISFFFGNLEQFCFVSGLESAFFTELKIKVFLQYPV